MTGPGPSVFVSYSHEDEAWKDRVVQHLRVLQHQGDLDLWDDRRIVPGEPWHDAIWRALGSSSVALLLVSANSLTSEFILDKEVPELLRRRATEGLRLIPVILRPCAWRDVSWLASIQAFPRDGRPLSSLPEHEVDAELAALAREVRRSHADAGAKTASGSPVSVPPVVAPAPASAPVAESERDPLRNYEFIKVIRSGNYGRVLKCVRRDTGETCIVKETDAARVSEPALAALAGIRCPNMAGARMTWRSDLKVFEELPYVGGVPVQDAIAPGIGGLSGSVLESFHSQIDRVLETLHGAGIVHRDIHPANIYLVVRRPAQIAGLSQDDPESSWVFDAFGEGDDALLIAWVLVDTTFATLASDTVQYAFRHGPYTPEEQESASATTASDMYAFGATMYFGMTGEDPPSAQNRRVNPRATIDVRGARHPSVKFEEYVAQLLALNADERPPAGFGRRLPEATIGAEYCGTLMLGSDAFLLVDRFPMRTRVVSRREALRIHQEMYQAPWFAEVRPWLAQWSDWLGRDGAAV
jgi:hypothetical protein